MNPGLQTSDGPSVESEPGVIRYTAAGGVVVHMNRVLVLSRPERDEVRLPKGHAKPCETLEIAALREVREESGFGGLAIRANLGEQVVTFEYQGQCVIRGERYFLMTLASWEEPGKPEEQFVPIWLDWDDALAELTFEAEREWVRRARAAAGAL